MTAKKRGQRRESNGVVGEKEANGQVEPHTNVS